ncbi:MAG: hypothetical protein GY950_22785 [bacterium]|nr:hypothetical protein [bacterium]
MNNKQAYELKLDEIRSIEKNRIKHIKNIPVATYAMEAENLYIWCQQDKEQLTAKGLSWDWVIDLPIRCGALREAEANWNTEHLAVDDAAKKWAKEYPAAAALRKTIAHEFRFAFAQDDDLLMAVRTAAQGKAHARLIQSLNDLSVIGKKNAQLLTAVNFDMSLLDKAGETSWKMAPLLATVINNRMRSKQAKTIRDQAFTHLKEAVDPIFRFGRHVFHDNEERRRGYRSQYLHRKRSKDTSPEAVGGQEKTRGNR